MVMPEADGTIGDADRVQAAGVYSGIAIQIAEVILNNLKILSLRLNPQLSMSISYCGNTLPIDLIGGIPIVPPPSDKGMVLYVSGGVLKLAAWNGAAWVTT
jgi:hypothetical protein